jgi:T4-like virus tail tube protein gp19
VALVTDTRADAVAAIGLELDGVLGDFPYSAQGGDPVGYVVNEFPNLQGVVDKHVAGVTYSELVLTCGAVVSPALFNWLTDMLERRFPRKSGAIVMLDYRGAERSRLTFRNGFISEIGFPALDLASHDNAKLTVKVYVESTQQSAPTGPAVGQLGGESSQGAATGGTVGLPAMQSSQGGSASDFRLAIDGLDCTRVVGVDALTVRWTSVQRPLTGGIGGYEVGLCLEIEDLVVTIPESAAATFSAWHEDFVIAGHNDPTREKTGTLEYLSSDRRQTLFTLGLGRLGIYKLVAEQPQTAGSTPHLRAHMYCAGVRLSHGVPVAAAPASAVASPPVSRVDAQPQAEPGLIAPANGQVLAPDVAGVGLRSTRPPTGQPEAGPGLIAPANGQVLAPDIAGVGVRSTGGFTRPYHLVSFIVSPSGVNTTAPVTLTVRIDRPADVDIPVQLFVDGRQARGFVVRRGLDQATTTIGTYGMDLGHHTLTVRLAGAPGDDEEELTRSLDVYHHWPAALATQ